MRLAILAGWVLAGVLALAGLAPAFSQDGQMMRAPLPPQRPFDLDLTGSLTLPPIVVPPPAQGAEAPPAQAPAPQAPGPQAPAPDPASPTTAEPDEDQGPEWPRLTPGQKAGAEPQFDPTEKPDRPGISTDPGTSIACLPPRLKQILSRISDKYGAVKVTSTWRPLWRARRGSYHRRCEAVDFRVPGIRPSSVMDWVRTLPEVGGHKVYWNGILHLDTGPRRPW